MFRSQSSSTHASLQSKLDANMQENQIEDFFSCREKNFIAKGQNGAVYRDVYQNLPVAIKIVDDRNNAEHEIRINLHIRNVQEANGTALPVTVPFYGYTDVGTNYQMVFMLMEITLETFINSDDYNDQSILNFSVDIIKAFEFLHYRAKVLWVDAKAANVLLKNNRAYIGDLGLSCKKGSEPNVPEGTPITMAPELQWARTTNTYESDIWALGLMLHHAITRRKAFTEFNSLNDDEFRDVIVAMDEPVTFTTDETKRQPLLTKLSLLACKPKPELRATAVQLVDEISKFQV